MKVILSPAKKMRVETDFPLVPGRPVFLEEADKIRQWLLEHSFEEAKKLWACQEKLARENYERLQVMDLERALTPAILAYDGIQYTTMAPSVFEKGDFAYVQQHVRILSGFYGVLRPLDGVVPYRLEMGAKLHRPLEGHSDLYGFWGERLFREIWREEIEGREEKTGEGLGKEERPGEEEGAEKKGLGEEGTEEERMIVNLASAEYAKAVIPYVKDKETLLTCIFGELTGDKLVQKGVYAKMARGEMVRYMAKHRVKKREELEGFSALGYHLDLERSSREKLVFVREDDGKKIGERQDQEMGP